MSADQSRSEILSALRALRDGDLAQQLSVEDRTGEDAEIAQAYNDLVQRLNVFADEVTRICREVGTEGRFGGQAVVPGVEGSWKDLVANVNFMAYNLTDQFRDIAAGVTARANGDMTRRVTVRARGEVAELKTTLNTMGDQFGVFAEELRRIAREAGVEGKFGGQTEVPGLSGVWKEISDDMNLMNVHLTNQVRDLNHTVRGIVEGNPTRRATAPAAGETRELMESVNRLVDSAKR